MSTKYKILDQDKPYFITFSVVNWIDVFSRKLYRDILLESLAFCQKEKGLELFAYCIMSNHMHMMVRADGKDSLQGIIRDFKKYTSAKILKVISENQYESRKEWMLWMFGRAGRKNPNNKNFQFWQQNNHPIELFNNSMIKQKLDYIHNNPVRAGLVFSAEEYVYSSAKNYAGEKEYLMEVKYLE